MNFDAVITGSGISLFWIVVFFPFIIALSKKMYSKNGDIKD